MNKFSLPEILRYFLIGFIIIGVWYVCRPCQMTEICKTLGSAGTPVFAFVIGNITFFVYRSTFYSLLILRFLDLIHKDNVRDVLKSRYEIPNRYKAEVFWKLVQESTLENKPKTINLASAGTHLLYMTCCATLIGAAYIYFDSCISTNFCWLLFVSLVCGVSAVVSDYYIESLETFFLKSIEDNEIDKLAGQQGFKRKVSDEEQN